MFVNGKASCAGAVVRTSALSEIKRAGERKTSLTRPSCRSNAWITRAECTLTLKPTISLPQRRVCQSWEPTL